MRSVWRYSLIKTKEGTHLAEIYYRRIEKQGKEIFVNPFWRVIENWKELKERDKRVDRALSYGYYFVANENNELIMALDLKTNEPRTDVIIVKTDKELPAKEEFIKVTLDELLSL